MSRTAFDLYIEDLDEMSHLMSPGALLPTMGLSLSPSTAAAMMAFSSVAVVSNSLLLRTQFSGPSMDNASKQFTSSGHSNSSGSSSSIEKKQ